MSASKARRKSSAVRDRLESLKARKALALIPYLTVGWPDAGSFVEIAREVAGWGADLLLLGLPFSDPLVETPIVADCARKALEPGLSMTEAMDLVRRVSTHVEIPVMLSTSCNLLLHGGARSRCEAFRAAGCKGLMVADLPPEEGLRLEGISSLQDIDQVNTCTPSSGRARIQLACLHSRGFVALRAPDDPGEQQEIESRLEKSVREVRRYTVLPVCVETICRTPEGIVAAARHADGCIVATAFLEAISAVPPGKTVATAIRFTTELREALDAVPQATTRR